jgi:hypothetical protein
MQNDAFWKLPHDVISNVISCPFYINATTQSAFRDAVVPMRSVRSKKLPQITDILNKIGLTNKLSRFVICVHERRQLAFEYRRISLFVSRLLIDGNKWRMTVKKFDDIPPSIITQLIRSRESILVHFPSIDTNTDARASETWLNSYICCGFMNIYNFSQPETGYEAGEFTVTWNDDCDTQSTTSSTASSDISSNMSVSDDGNASIVSTRSNQTDASMTSSTSKTTSVYQLPSDLVFNIIGDRAKACWRSDPVRHDLSRNVMMMGFPKRVNMSCTKSSLAATIYCIVAEALSAVDRGIESGRVIPRNCKACMYVHRISEQGNRYIDWFDTTDPRDRACRASWLDPLVGYIKIKEILEGNTKLGDQIRSQSVCCIKCLTLCKILMHVTKMILASCIDGEKTHKKIVALIGDTMSKPSQLIKVPTKRGWDGIPLSNLWNSASSYFKDCEIHLYHYQRRSGLNLLGCRLLMIRTTKTEDAISWVIPRSDTDDFSVATQLINMIIRDESIAEGSVSNRSAIPDAYTTTVCLDGVHTRISCPIASHISFMASRLPLMMADIPSSKLPFQRSALYPLFLRNYLYGNQADLVNSMKWFAQLFYAPSKSLRFMTPDDPCVQIYRLLHVMFASYDSVKLIDTLIDVYRPIPGLVTNEYECAKRNNVDWITAEESFNKRRADNMAYTDWDHAVNDQMIQRTLNNRYDPVSRKNFYPDANPNTIILQTTIPSIYTAMLGLIFPRSCQVFIIRNLLIRIFEMFIESEDLWFDHIELVGLLYQMRLLDAGGTRTDKNYDYQMFPDSTGGERSSIPHHKDQCEKTRWHLWYETRRDYVANFAMQHMPLLANHNGPVKWCECSDCSFIKDGHFHTIQKVRAGEYQSLETVNSFPSLYEYVAYPLHPRRATKQRYAPYEVTEKPFMWAPTIEEFKFHPGRRYTRKDRPWIMSGEWMPIPRTNTLYPGSQLPPHCLFYRLAADPRIHISIRRLIFESMHAVPETKRHVQKPLLVNRPGGMDSPGSISNSIPHVVHHLSSIFTPPQPPGLDYTGPSPDDDDADVRPGGLIWESYLTKQQPTSASSINHDDSAMANSRTKPALSVAELDYRTRYANWFAQGFGPIPKELVNNVEFFPFVNIAHAAMTLEALSFMPTVTDDPPHSTLTAFPDFYGHGLRRRDLSASAVIATFDLPHLRALVSSGEYIPIGYRTVSPSIGAALQSEIVTIPDLFMLWPRARGGYYDCNNARRNCTEIPAALTHCNKDLLTVIQTMPINSIAYETIKDFGVFNQTKDEGFICVAPRARN